MKKTILFLLICLFTTAIFSQKQGDKWIFGYQCGLDFSVPGVYPTSFTSTLSANMAQEGVSCISDNTGSLLAYCDGRTAYNRLGLPMQNGQGLKGGTSSTMSCLFVPMPRSQRYFYLFTTGEFEIYQNGGYTTMRYSIVDMCADNGYGGVDSLRKNILLLDTTTEKLAGCLDSNRTGYWVVTHKLFSNKFVAFHVTAEGITDTVISTAGLVHRSAPCAQGEMKINSQGTKVAVAVGNEDTSHVEVFDFDNASGVVSDGFLLRPTMSANSSSYGVEWSPDGTRLYTTAAGGHVLTQGLYQYDMTAGSGNIDSITDSKILLYNPSNSIMGGVQMAPDNHIYVIMETGNALGVIHNPNRKGNAAGFDPAIVPITGTVYKALPNFVAGYQYLNTVINCTEDTTTGTGMHSLREEVDFSMFPNPASDQFFITCEGAWGVELLTIQGEKIRNLLGQGKTSFSTQGLPAGIYFISLKQGNRTSTKKLIVH